MSNNKFTEVRPPSYGTMSSTGEIVIPIPQQSNERQQLSTASQEFDSEDRTAQHGAYVSFSNFSDDEEDEEERDYRTLFNEYLITTPFIIFALISFIILLYVWPTGGQLYKWDIFLLGATGWCSVFLIRKPTYFILNKLINLKESFSSILTLFFIGFIEEMVRMGWLLYFEGDNYRFLTAYWLGLGWATAEAVYFIIQNFVEIRWYKDGMERYSEEREELEEILGRPFTKVSAWWGVMWRFSWIMIHIGFSCWIDFSPALIYAAGFIHGLLLIIWGYCLPVFGIPATSYGTFLVSLIVFLIGLALLEQIA